MRKWIIFALIGLVTGLALLILRSGDVEPPATAPTDFSNPPAVISDAKYASYELVYEFGVPHLWLMEWLSTDDRFVSVMEETENIKKPIETVYLSGDWPNEGAVRRVKLSDGHYTFERVIVNNLPDQFQYQIWGFTTKAGQNLEYTLGTQYWEVIDGDRTQLTWSYELLPNSGFKRGFVQNFVDSDIKPFLDGAVERVAANAEADYVTSNTLDGS